MAFIDELLESGGNFIVERTDDGASFRAISTRDADLQSFEALVRKLRGHDGEGYRIFGIHESSDAAPHVDLVVVTIDQSRVHR